uniref:hypothetical protein n=1 Tax=unclassified Micromonospora TaxID=2617518 RepID=UPI0033A57ABC
MARIDQKRKEQAKVYEIVENLRGRLAEQNRRAADLENTRSLLKLAARQRSELPKLEIDRRKVGSQQERIRLQINDLNLKAEALGTRAELDAATLEELGSTEQLLAKRQGRLRNRIREVEQLSRALGQHVPLENPLEVTQLKLSTQAEIESIREKRRTQDKAGLLLDVVEALVPPLEVAERDGLGREVIADLPGRLATVADLKAGLIRRATGLDSQIDNEGIRLQKLLSTLEERERRLVDLERAARLLGTARRDVAECEDTIRRALAHLSGNTEREYRALGEDRVAKLQELESLAATAAELDRAIDELTAHGTVNEVQQTLRETGALNLSEDDVKDALEELQESRRLVEHELKQATMQQASVADDLADLQAELLRAVNEISGPTWSWLGESGLQMPNSDSTLERNAFVLDKIRDATDKVSSEILSAERDLTALSGSLDIFVQSLNQGRYTAQGNPRFLAEVRQHYEAVFTDQLSTSEVRKALFDQGGNVALDLAQMVASWTTPSGEQRSRPLEAFSSGERAFAYTRVQLERLKDEHAANKVAFLDEFGAYVARDRLDDLLSFLDRRALRGLVDQVVIILPLTSTPVGEKAQELKDQRYFTVDLARK